MDISRIAKVVLKNSSPITDTHTKVTTVGGTLLGFQEFFLQPIIKDRPNRAELFVDRSG